MQYNKSKANKTWQNQDCKHQILQHLPPSAQPALQALQQPAELTQQPNQQGQQMLYLNWSHFKPEFSGKPEEDAEGHLLRTND